MQIYSHKTIPVINLSSNIALQNPSLEQCIAGANLCHQLSINNQLKMRLPTHTHSRKEWGEWKWKWEEGRYIELYPAFHNLFNSNAALWHKQIASYQIDLINKCGALSTPPLPAQRGVTQRYDPMQHEAANVILIRLPVVEKHNFNKSKINRT